MYRGVIVFMLCDEGSKSECMQPFLYIGNGRFVRLWMVDDNPFEHEMLHAFDGKNVWIKGEFDEEHIFYVTEIQTENSDDELSELDEIGDDVILLDVDDGQKKKI